MANANRTAWHASQRKVFNEMRQFITRPDADAFAEARRAEGFSASVRPFTIGPKKAPIRRFNVHWHKKA